MSGWVATVTQNALSVSDNGVGLPGKKESTQRINHAKNLYLSMRLQAHGYGGNALRVIASHCHAQNFSSL